MKFITQKKLNDCFEEAQFLGFGIKKIELLNIGNRVCKPPHRHDFYYILVIKKGRGKHVIDFNHYKVTSNSIFFVTPGQVHSLELAQGTEGYALFFKRDFYNEDLHKFIITQSSFFHSFNTNPVINNNKMPKDVYTLLDDIYKEFKNPQMGRNTVIKATINILLLKFSRLFKCTQEAMYSLTHQEKMRKLEMLIDTHYKTLRNLEAYADLMLTSAQHLNDLCKQFFDKTVPQLIHKRTVLEAKRLLKFTSFSIAQIAHELAFWDIAYFFRYFKRQTGITPDSYRNKVKILQ